MTLTLIISLIAIHFILDFWFQSEQEALNKSTSWKWLLSHTTEYSTWWAALIFVLAPQDTPLINVFWFFLITLVLHTVTDWASSRLTKKFYSEGKMYGVPGFWFIISLDQLFHIAQILITHNILFH